VRLVAPKESHKRISKHNLFYICYIEQYDISRENSYSAFCTYVVISLSLKCVFRDNGISFHRFPKDEKLRRLWIRATKRKKFFPCPSSVLCSTHFKKEDFKSGTKIKSLKPGTIPSDFNFPAHCMSSKVILVQLSKRNSIFSATSSKKATYVHHQSKSCRGC